MLQERKNGVTEVKGTTVNNWMPFCPPLQQVDSIFTSVNLVFDFTL